jgi:TfoX/Sxy family transcriptional regulator of competence genes
VATRKETVEHILDQLAPLPARARAMFGEYGLYCGEKFVGVICDDTLFIKPTAISDELFPDPEMAPPYPGARDHHVVSDDRLHDAAWLQEVVARTAEQLPVPRKRASRAADRKHG